jgi:hypothetical protein
MMEKLGNSIPYVRQIIQETGEEIKIDRHGHDERGGSAG